MIDQKIIDAHQWVVDESERKPAWWAEHVAWASTAIGLVAYILIDGAGVDLSWIATIFLSLALMILACRIQIFFYLIGSKAFVRAFFGANLIWRIVLFASSPTNWRAAYMLEDALLLSFIYFAACQPPRPRKRRQTAAQGVA